MGDVSQLTKMGVALGSGTYGDAASSFTRGLLVSNFSASPVHGVERVSEVRGDLTTRRTTKGPITYETSMAFPLDVGDATSASVGDFLASLMGTETPTDEGAGLYKHKFTLSASDLPSWLNLWSDKDAIRKQIKGFRPGSIKFTINSGEGQIPVEVTGISQTEAALDSDQSLAFADEPIIVPSDASTIKVGGDTVTNFDTLDITIAREQEGFKALDNNRYITKLISGKSFSIIVNMSGLNFADETERDKFTGNNSSDMEFKFTDSNSNYLHFDFDEIKYQTWEGPDISDPDLLRLNMSALILGASTDFFVELQNEYAKRYDTGAAIT